MKRTTHNGQENKSNDKLSHPGFKGKAHITHDNCHEDCALPVNGNWCQEDQNADERKKNKPGKH
jgi:hypothetical protein